MNEFDRLKAQKDTIIAREKSEVAVAVGLSVYAHLVRLAHDKNQTVGEHEIVDYYVTLKQLEQAFITVRDELSAGAKESRE